MKTNTMKIRSLSFPEAKSSLDDALWYVEYLLAKAPPGHAELVAAYVYACTDRAMAARLANEVPSPKNVRGYREAFARVEQAKREMESRDESLSDA